MNRFTKRSAIKRLAVGFLLLVAGVLVGQGALATDEADLVDGEGVVQEISLATGSLVISGFHYRVVPHADVRVRGSSSSIAGLVVGMKVQFLYENFTGFKAEMSAVEEGNLIHSIEQLPDSYEVQQH